VEESDKQSSWLETEWGFPKGRRNHKESDYDCALREFNEETGYNVKYLQNLQNIIPYEEIFTGSNYKSYKHKYFIMFMSYNNSLLQNEFEKTEVSKMEWKSYNQCMESIRPYNKEKMRLITNIHECITSNVII
jgi:8-oxo-dGTP pyrophosphatase MutT (NUDIX family)